MYRKIFSVVGMLFLLIGCGDEFHAKHNQGKNCLECHSFSSGVTIFKSIHAVDYDENDAARGYNIQLDMTSGEKITYQSGNGYGNVLSHSRDIVGTFTAQVVDDKGTVLNQSHQDTHDESRLACNRCHTQEGKHGAPGRVVIFDYFNTLVTDINSSGA